MAARLLMPSRRIAEITGHEIITKQWLHNGWENVHDVMPAYGDAKDTIKRPNRGDMTSTPILCITFFILSFVELTSKIIISAIKTRDDQPHRTVKVLEILSRKLSRTLRHYDDHFQLRRFVVDHKLLKSMGGSPE